MLESFRRHTNFIKKYATATNASSGSEFDSNANVENKNITTCMGEIPKKEMIGTNRLLMHDKLTELYDVALANEYIRQLENHEIYKHDETSILPYCVSITMYPFLFGGLKNIGGISEPPKNLKSFQGSFINLVFAIASQFAGAVATPEYFMYLDYFIRREYGENYYEDVDRIVDLSLKRRTLDKVITDGFKQVTYSMNQPAAARNFQSVFWNVAYFDKPYFEGMFSEFIFPDYSSPKCESLNWLQKRYMKWLNKERTKKILTFPVETLNLLNDGVDYVDKEWKDFQAEMYAEGHSFFTYTSNSVDSLASCCFGAEEMCLSRSSEGVNLMSFKELYDSPYSETKKSFTIFHNGSWVNGKLVKLKSNRQMYKITTANKKEMIVTDNHIFPTINGDKSVFELTTNDHIMFNSRRLDTFPEKNKGLTYEEGILIGMYLGDGSIYDKNENHTPIVNLSLNESKYIECKDYINKVLLKLDNKAKFNLQTPYNNVYPTTIRSRIIRNFIREYVSGGYCYNKELNMDCLLQSYEFRLGILDGYYMTDGGNSNRIYTTSEKLVGQIECLITSLGFNSVIDYTDRTNEKVVIRGQEFNRNYPLYCIRWYDPKNKRTMKNLFIIKNNCEYFKIKSIEKIEYNEDHVYCFEMTNKEEPYFTLPNGCITHNCRLKNELQDNTFSYTLGAGGVATGSKGVITINLNRLVQDAFNVDVDISLAVEEQIKKTHKYLNAYNEIVKDYYKANLLPIYNAGYISLEKQFLTIGINGFVEGAEFLGIEISPNDAYFEYGEKILKPIYTLNKLAKTKEFMVNTEIVPAENLGVKNVKWDRKDGYFVPRDCYNSYFYLVEDETCNILDKFILHGSKLTKYLDGGSALHANLDEHLSFKQYLKLGVVAIKTGCQYYTYNIPNTICNECGYISKHKLDKCPKCGSSNLDYATRIIGYLKRVSKFAEARIREAKRRYYAR